MIYTYTCVGCLTISRKPCVDPNTYDVKLCMSWCACMGLYFANVCTYYWILYTDICIRIMHSDTSIACQLQPWSNRRTSKEEHYPCRRDPFTTCGRQHPICWLPIWTWICTRNASSRQMLAGNRCRQLQYTITSWALPQCDLMILDVSWCRNYFIQC